MFNQVHILLILFEFAVLLFAFSVHESAHAWTAARLGDPTAYMLGRVTLNPIVHIDPFGTLLMPLLGLLTGGWLIGWAKPCPVNTRNFHKVRRDDMLVTFAGPASNLLIAILCLLLLLVIEHAVNNGGLMLYSALDLARTYSFSQAPQSMLFPIVLLLYIGMQINLLLFVFNLIPIPPLDGSRILRNLLPYNAQRAFDRIGGVGIILVLVLSWFLLPIVYGPLLGVFDYALGL